MPWQVQPTFLLLTMIVSKSLGSLQCVRYFPVFTYAAILLIGLLTHSNAMNIMYTLLAY